MDVKVIETIDEIRDEWEKLLQESDTATVFQSPEWVEAWGPSLMLGVYEDKQLVGIGAFEQVNGKIKFVGMRQNLSDFGDITAQRGQEKQVWNALLKFFNFQFSNFQIQLDFIRETSPSFAILKKRGKVEKQEVSPQIDLPRSWDEYLQELPRKKRHELKRKMKRVEGELEIKENISDEDADNFIEMVRGSSEEKGKFMDPETANFFRKIINLGRLFVLPVAMVLGFEWKNGWYLYNSGYTEKDAGIALFGMIIREATKRKIDKVDFLRGSERYKYDLGAKDQQLYNIIYE